MPGNLLWAEGASEFLSSGKSESLVLWEECASHGQEDRFEGLEQKQGCYLRSGWNSPGRRDMSVAQRGGGEVGGAQR
jgi:hypothetical protein